MTTEQKAKAYDKAFVRAKGLYAKGAPDTLYLEEIFPELKESGDERIKKALLELVHDTTGDELWVDYNVHKEDALTWLEKQGEKKPVIEGTFVNVDEVREEFMQEVYRVLNADPTNDRANQIIDAFDHLPTIIIQKPADWNKDDEEHFARCLKLMKIVLDTKPYPYYNDYLWLKSLKDRVCCEANCTTTKEWSKEDERLLSKLQTYVDLECFDRECNGQDLINWLESLRPQNTGKLSEEDEDYYDAIIAKLEITQDDAALTDNQMKFLKSLKDKIK